MKTISREELKKLIDKKEKIVLINVLSEEKFEDEHIPSSINIPFDDDDEDFVKQVGEIVADKNAAIVVYCASLECPASRNAAEALDKAGYTNIRAYEGGMQGWIEASYPVEGEKPSKSSSGKGGGSAYQQVS